MGFLVPIFDLGAWLWRSGVQSNWGIRSPQTQIRLHSNTQISREPRALSRWEGSKTAAMVRISQRPGVVTWTMP